VTEPIAPPPLPYANETPPAPLRARNGLALGALVLAVIAILSCWTILGGITSGLFAMGTGFAARRRVKRGEATNGGVAIAAIVLGLIAVVASIAIGWLGYIELRNSGALDCIKGAQNGDQAKIEQCTNNFRDYFTKQYGTAP
jgi:hypothetical protein